MSALFIAEPPAPYGVLRPVVVDSSFIAAIVFDEEAQQEATNALKGCQPVAPTLIGYEVCNVGMNKLRRRECDSAEVCEALGYFDAFPLTLVEPRLEETFLLAARYKLSAYDASYLWLAAEMKSPLLTFDKQLAAAARDHLAQLPPP